MYIKFLNKGSGKPSRAAAYLISDKDHKKNKRADVKILRGDPQTFTAIAESLTFKLRYTSAVIAFAESDNPTSEDISEVLDAFEKHAFSGLEKHQYHMTAVMHEEDDGSKHVHILVPRVELESKKSLNIAPPGHAKYYDPLRDYFNYKKGWARPDDINLKRDTQQPHHEHFKAKVLERLNDKQSVIDARKLINSYLRQRIESDLIINRDDVIDALKDIGHITRIGKDYISFRPNTASKAIRLKGAFYESNFNIKSYFEDRSRERTTEATSTTDNENSTANSRLAQLEFERFTKLSEQRATHNNEYYNEVERRKSERNAKHRAELDVNQDIRTTNESSSNIDRSNRFNAEEATANTRRTDTRIESSNSFDARQLTTNSKRADTGVERRNNSDAERAKENNFDDEQPRDETVGLLSNLEKRNTASLRTTGEYQKAEKNQLVYTDANSIFNRNTDNQNLDNLNERTATTTQSRANETQEPSYSPERDIETIRELKQRINDTKRVIATTKRSIVSNDTASRATTFRDKLTTAFSELFKRVRNTYQSAFNRQIESTVKRVTTEKHHRTNDFKTNRATENGFDFTDLTTLFAQFERYRRNRLERDRKLKRDIERAIANTIQITEVNQSSNKIINYLEHSPIKPQTHAKATEAIKSNEVRKLSADADSYFLDAIRKKDGWQYFELLNKRLISLNNSTQMIFKRDELDCIDAIIENDKAHIEYLKNNFKKDNANFHLSDTEHAWLACVEKSTQKIEQTLYEKRLKQGFITERSYEPELNQSRENRATNNKDNNNLTNDL
jgi:hypothetical protein